MDQRQRERGNKMNAARRLSPDNFMTDSNTVQTAAMEREGEEGREEKDTVIKSWDMNRERGGRGKRAIVRNGTLKRWLEAIGFSNTDPLLVLRKIEFR
jgi:hypothetical protein